MYGKPLMTIALEQDCTGSSPEVMGQGESLSQVVATARKYGIMNRGLDKHVGYPSALNFLTAHVHQCSSYTELITKGSSTWSHFINGLMQDCDNRAITPQYRSIADQIPDAPDYQSHSRQLHVKWCKLRVRHWIKCRSHCLMILFKAEEIERFGQHGSLTMNCITDAEEHCLAWVPVHTNAHHTLRWCWLGSIIFRTLKYSWNQILRNSL